VQQLLQAAPPSASATKLFQRLHSLRLMPLLPVARHSLREAIELLLHQQAAAAVSAVAMT
jgi:hypothetical protein